METVADTLGLEASTKTIDVLIVIDTEYVKDLKDANNQPIVRSTEPNKPTRLPAGTGQFMLVTGSRNTTASPVEGQGTGKLVFKANPQDVVRFRGQSIYANADDAVIIYRIVYASGDEVFNGFASNTAEIVGAAFPSTGKDSQGLSVAPVPAVNKVANFVNISTQVAKRGTESYYVYFGLYTLDSDSEKQVLLGYYDCDPSIKVA